MKYTVFADTFYWIALTAPRDLHSQDAVRFDNLFSEGAVFTTQEVLSELLAFFSGNARLRNRAVATVRHIMSDPSVRVIPQSNESFMSGLELYAARRIKHTASRTASRCRRCAEKA